MKHSDKNFRQGTFGQYAGAPSLEQLSLYFHLSDTDKLLMKNMKHNATKLGFAIQLGTVRFLGVFPIDFSDIPTNVVIYTAKQLEIDPTEISAYKRKMTISQHRNQIKTHFNFQDFTNPAVLEYLKKWLLDRAMYTTETREMLFDMLLKKCLDEKILLPGITTFDRFIGSIVDVTEENLYQLLANVPPLPERKKLLNLLELAGESQHDGSTKIDSMRAPLIDSTQKELARGFKRLLEYKRFQTKNWDISTITEGKLHSLAEYVFRAKTQAIKKMDPTKQLGLLVAFIYVYQKKAIDEQLLALIEYYETIFKRAKRKEEKERLRSIKDLDNAASTLSKVVEVIMDPTIEENTLRATVFNLFPEPEIETAVSQVNKLVRNEAEPVAIAELCVSHRKFKKFIPNIIETLHFASNQYGLEVMGIWKLIQERFPKTVTFKQYAQISHLFPAKWRYYIHNNPQLVNQCVLIVSIELFVKSLKRHDIFVESSQKYADPMATLLDDETWKDQRSVLIQQLNLPLTGAHAVQQLTHDLTLSYKTALTNWRKSSMARVEVNGNGEKKLVVSKLRKKALVGELKKTKNRAKQLMPQGDLTDILLEVNQRTGLTQAFVHTNERESRMKELDISLLAVLVSEACNIGYSPISKEHIASLKTDRLTYVNHQYLRIDTLSEANNKLIQAHHELPLSSIWGDSQMAAADGIRYVTPQRSLYSRANPKYFGRGKGVTFYNFVSDQYIGFHGMVVAGTLRDSLYLLEGLLNQSSGLEPKQIMTDTAGYSDLVFGLFGLLGYQFSPRIANSHKTKLWRIDKDANYGELTDFTKNNLNINLIEEHWDDILRVGASLKSGKVYVPELIRALQRDGQPTPLGRALIEYGKIYRTKHQLRYLTDEEYARQILEQLNKIESRHTLCRYIFHGKKGKLYQTYFTGMEEQLTALSVVTNAVIYWNTLYLEKVIEQLKREGYECSQEIISHISPLLCEHINFMGKYTFNAKVDVENDNLRPLNFEERSE
ncbi:TPA: Tn3 family transposase [Enterococcus faecalis]|nr:Tn3 family transposase [Enterococcus faecalis]